MDRYRFGPTINLGALQDYFNANPGRFVFDALVTRQNSLEQDFDAGEDVYAGYGMVAFDFAKWNLLAGVRVESTHGRYSAHELLFASGAFTGRTRPAVGETDYTDVLPGIHANFFPNSQPHRARRLDQHAGPAELREPGADQRPGRHPERGRHLLGEPVHGELRDCSRTSP